ncbi:hypothetical protein CC2G_008481 [Coprinopsis cinerea AmutBmut pab1-1]|nr:hypothetical protein CC2G_008481 [Coprinopsis cinerea AmutBmut pab1-1]
MRRNYQKRQLFRGFVTSQTQTLKCPALAMSAEQLLKDDPVFYQLPKPRPYVFQKPDLVNLNPALGKRVFPKVFAIPMRS